MKKSLIMILCIAVAAGVQGRIGETLEQCRERYGPAEQSDDGRYVFAKSGFMILVGFHNGKADSIAYGKMKRDELGISEELSEVEIKTLLDSNCPAVDWEERTVISMNTEWQTEDGETLAIYYNIEHLLIVFTRDFMERENAAKAKKEKANLEGF